MFTWAVFAFVGGQRIKIRWTKDNMKVQISVVGSTKWISLDACPAVGWNSFRPQSWGNKPLLSRKHVHMGSFRLRGWATN